MSPPRGGRFSARWLLGAREWLRMLLFRRNEDAEMDEELRFHVDMETEANIRRGMEPRAARRQARIAFGGMEGHRDALRQGRRWPVLEDAWLDLRYGTVSLRRMPGFAVTIVVALALGIGTSVAVFSVLRQMVTDAVPFERPEQLFSVGLSDSRGFGMNPSLDDFRAWRSAVTPAATLAGHTLGGGAIGDGSHTTRAISFRVTTDFFSILGVRPLHGRAFSPDDHLPSGPDVVMLTERLWERHFGGNPDIIGRALQVEGQPHTVVGIVPAGLQFPAVADFWVPLRELESGTSAPSVGVIGRAGAGAMSDASGRATTTTTATTARDGLREVHVRLQTLQSVLDTDRPEAERAGRVELLPLTGRDADRMVIAVRLLQGAVLLVLLIGIANGAGLLLTRGMLRRREFAVRTSLGASRFRIVRQILAESSLLAAAGGALGMGVGWGAVALLRSGLPPSMTRQMLGWEHLGIDGGAALFALGLSAAAALACGIVPALHAVRGDPSAGLKEEGAGALAGHRGGRISRLLVVGEVTLSLTLLLTAGLLTRSLVELIRIDPGYQAEGVLTVEWVLPPDGYHEDGAVERLQAELLERVRGNPGVNSAGLISTLPTAPFGTTRRFRSAGSDANAETMLAAWRPVTPDYMHTMGIELLQGRAFGDQDGPMGERVVIVDESLARAAWPEVGGAGAAGTAGAAGMAGGEGTAGAAGVDAGADGAGAAIGPTGGFAGDRATRSEPLGAQLDVDGELWTVVGVARTLRNPAYPRALTRTLYVPQAQAPTRSGFLALRTAGDAALLPVRVHDAIWGLDPDIAIGETATMGEILSDLRGPQRIMAVAISLFASIALVITIISLYALVAHAVARRQREFGIRLALGAGPGQILRRAMLQGMLWVGVGTALGLLLSAGVAGILTGLLHGVRPLDPLVFTLVPAALLVLALLASYLPARRAARVDPLVSLRSD